MPDLKDYDKATIRVMLDAARKLRQTKAQKARVAILKAEYGARRA